MHARGASQQQIAGVLGTSQGTAGRRIKEWGWGPARLRGHRPYIPKFSFLPECDEAERAESDLPENDLRGRMKRLVSREMRRIETCGGPALEIARTLAALTQTMKALNALPAPDPDEEMDIDAFRIMIARRLEALCAEDEG